MSSTRASAVTVLLPGLLGPQSAARDDGAALAALVDDLELPALTMLLARSRVLARSPAGAALMPMLLELLDCRPDAQGEWPLAAWSRLACGEPVADRAWVRADPVHLRADMGKLLLFPAESLELTLEEAAGLIEHLNAEMEDQLPAPLELLSAGHWSMPLETVPRVHTHAPIDLHGADVGRHLPSGEDAGAWHRLGNEIQMVLHDAPVNRAREARGAPAVNSLWFWGVGAIAETIDPSRAADGSSPRLATGERVATTRVWCRHDWACGAADWRGARSHAREPASARSLLEDDEAHHLVCLDALPSDDPTAWREALLACEARWLTPLVAAVRAGTLSQLTVHAGHALGGELTRALAARFWRRRRALSTLMLRWWQGRRGAT